MYPWQVLLLAHSGPRSRSSLPVSLPLRVSSPVRAPSLSPHPCVGVYVSLYLGSPDIWRGMWGDMVCGYLGGRGPGVDMAGYSGVQVHRDAQRDTARYTAGDTAGDTAGYSGIQRDIQRDTIYINLLQSQRPEFARARASSEHGSLLSPSRVSLFLCTTSRLCLCRALGAMRHNTTKYLHAHARRVSNCHCDTPRRPSTTPSNILHLPDTVEPDTVQPACCACVVCGDVDVP